MKKIILLLAVVGLTFSSCYKDEYTAPDGGETVKKAYFTTDSETVAASATAHDVTVNFTSPFANDVLLSYTLDGTDAQVTVPAGSTSFVIGSVDVSTVGNSHTAIINAIASNSESVAVDTDRNNYSVLVPYPGTAGILRFYVSWDDLSRDIDPKINTGADNSGTTIDGAYSSSNPEVVDFPETEADGLYYLYLNEWAFTADVNYTITAVKPDGTNLVFTGVVHEDSDVMTFTKTTTGGVIDYTFTVL